MCDFRKVSHLTSLNFSVLIENMQWYLLQKGSSEDSQRYAYK